MNSTEKERFVSLWSDFKDLVRGKLITAANTQTLSPALANLILSDAASAWNSQYDISGKWLSDLKKSEPEKAALISEILLSDMKFTEIDTGKVLPNYYNYVIPIAGACVGLAISAYCGGGKIVQIASTVIPAVLLYPAVTSFRKNQRESNKDRNIDLFMEQLEKFKNSVVTVLS